MGESGVESGVVSVGSVWEEVVLGVVRGESGVVGAVDGEGAGWRGYRLAG